MSENFEIDIEVDQQEQDLIAVERITLEGTLKLLKSDGLLSDLDSDLHKVHSGKKAMTDHKEYFSAQADNKLKKLSIIYHPDLVQSKGGSEEEVLKATAIQAKINAVRDILKYFNENFAQYDDFQYSHFSKVEVDLLGNKQRLEQISYTVLNKLGELSYTKHEKLIPNLNQFLKSGQNSVRGFTADNFNKFLKEKSNAEFYFREYLYAYKELFTDLKSFYELCKEDNYMKPIVAQMLNECSIQGKILTKIDDFLGQSEFQRTMLINANLIECECPYCINNQGDYQKADEYFTLPFIEYINILAICHEVYSAQEPRSRNLLESWVLSLQIVCNIHKNNKEIRRADNEVIENSNDLLSLHRLSHHLLAYYCYGNEASRKSAAKSLRVDPLNKEDALQLLIQVIDVYSSYLEREFPPEKDFYERILEVQMKIFETIENVGKGICKEEERFCKMRLELDRENLVFCKQVYEIQLEDSEQISRKRSHFQRASEIVQNGIKYREAVLARMNKNTDEKTPESIEKEQNKTSCSLSSQQCSKSQAGDQPGPGSKLGGVRPISRSQSLSSLHSNDSDIEVISISQCR